MSTLKLEEIFPGTSTLENEIRKYVQTRETLSAFPSPQAQ